MKKIFTILILLLVAFNADAKPQWRKTVTPISSHFEYKDGRSRFEMTNFRRIELHGKKKSFKDTEVINAEFSYPNRTEKIGLLVWRTTDKECAIEDEGLCDKIIHCLTRGGSVTFSTPNYKIVISGNPFTN